ncbi:uncharacterized protein [Coffea arabica]|uniref:Helitron helicase-like domain-containing protein n=1 Tax=Coffea arabica TaxID=13443 RepID=A0ABM4VYV5_COFAR
MHYDKELGKKYNGIYTFRVQGQMYHFINPLVPADGQKPVNLQLYFYDTEHEVENRLSISSKFREILIAMLAYLLKVNSYSSFFHGLQDLPNLDEYRIMLQSNPTVDQHIYNKPTVSQIRPEDKSMLLHIGRLLQQYVVDMYIKIETSRLDFFRNYQNQNRLRIELYQGFLDSISSGEINGSNVGKRFILPRSFIGGPRDMKRRYLDAMTLVQPYGKPDIFLTMTCNKSWPEIKKLLLPTEKTDNRPDLVSQVFQAKLQILKNELFKKHIFGKVAAYTYVIEFQKRGLSHAHFLIILKHCSKLLTPEAYDRIVSVELPDIHIHKHIHSLVAQHMIHGPCGQMNPNCACVQKTRICKDNYPKHFAESTRHSQNSYPIYRRTDNKRTVKVRGHHLDNRWIFLNTLYGMPSQDTGHYGSKEIIATSFRQAADLLDLLQTDNSAEICLAEAVAYQMPSLFRHLFATILVYCNPPNCKELWLKFKAFLSEDIQQNKTLSAEVVNARVL